MLSVLHRLLCTCSVTTFLCCGVQLYYTGHGFSFDIVKGVTIYTSHVRFEIILSGLALKDVRVISPYSHSYFFQTFFYFSNALRYPLYMPKSNVLSRGMKVFFSLLLAFFTSGCTIFPFVPLKRLSLGSWFCRTLLFFGIARIISTHSLLIHKIFNNH